MKTAALIIGIAAVVFFLLGYLQKTDIERYRAIIEKLNLRK